MRRIPRAGLAVAVLAVAVSVARGAASASDAPAPGYPCRAAIEPGLARIGQAVLYRGQVVVTRGTRFRWLAPAGGGAFEWGGARVRRGSAFSGSSARRADAPGLDTMQVELPLQAFEPGILTVPGLGFEAEYPPGPRRTGHLPTVRLAVVPVPGAEDSTAALRPLRGPLEAPWWERVPWRIVALVAVGLGIVALVARRLRRRGAQVAPPARARPPMEPGRVALEELEALRGLRLPEQGRFAAHALELTRILRRFLEATQGAPRPGDSTPELVAHLGASQLAPAERECVARLLAAWDRVKFACAASSPEEARRAEGAVEGLARRTPPGADGGGA